MFNSTDAASTMRPAASAGGGEHAESVDGEGERRREQHRPHVDVARRLGDLQAEADALPADPGEHQHRRDRQGDQHRLLAPERSRRRHSTTASVATSGDAGQAGDADRRRGTSRPAPGR